MPLTREAYRQVFSDPVRFALLGERALRSYQQEVARAVVESVLQHKGLSFAVMFPRQSGKNELQAQIEVYLLVLLQHQDADIVKVSPTWRPQSLNAMQRLERALEANPLASRLWSKESGYIYRIGRARIRFLSGAPESSIVGATASHLLEVDEAQDVTIAKYDREIAPMAASTNATRIFWGTAWTSQTLLARELRGARLAEQSGGGQRLAFTLSAETVAREVPAYGAFVAGQVARLGRNHPLVRTQFFSEEIDGQSGMFPPERIALMLGTHAPQAAPGLGRVYAMLLDVAGELLPAGEEHPAREELRAGEILPAGEGASLSACISASSPACSPAGEEKHDSESFRPGESFRRDATALTIVEVDLSTLADPALRAPTYRTVARRVWVGVKHAQLYGEIRALAETWRARWLVVDATGVGAGLASFLERALPGRVVPFLFNAASKSRLGWDFLALVDAGRWKEPVDCLSAVHTVGLSADLTGIRTSVRMQDDQSGNGRGDRPQAARPPAPTADIPGIRMQDDQSGDHSSAFTELFLRQCAYTQYEVLPGPARALRWGVPDGARDPQTGAYLHDDLVLSAALAAVLDRQPWHAPLAGVGVVRAKDPLEEMRGY